MRKGGIIWGSGQLRLAECSGKAWEKWESTWRELSDYLFSKEKGEKRAHQGKVMERGEECGRKKRANGHKKDSGRQRNICYKNRPVSKGGHSQSGKKGERRAPATLVQHRSRSICIEKGDLRDLRTEKIGAHDVIRALTRSKSGIVPVVGKAREYTVSILRRGCRDAQKGTIGNKATSWGGGGHGRDQK